jgi:hypothetical protein
VNNPVRVLASAALFLSLTPFCIASLSAQEPTARAPEPLAATQTPQDAAEQNTPLSCVQPPPMLRWQDYNGPFAKTVGVFARKLERKSVHPPHFKPGLILCTLEAKDKFLLFVHDTLDPVTFLSVGFNAGLDQAQNTDHSFGQGAAGYGRRFGAEFAGQATGGFFKDFAYPTVFSEDPRYYRLAHGSAGRRLAHALEHAVLAHRQNGTRMFNASEWLGTITTAVLSNTYHPDNQRGVAPASRRVAFTVLQDTGFDVLREFWPEAARKLKLPFRDENESAMAQQNSLSK